ncbi:MAG: DUF4138 domain-containing protein [Paludibacteraceae bacterium]|nr:DUF4138 domain-containing protein [Paludibacteraceae bacterium]
MKRIISLYVLFITSLWSVSGAELLLNERQQVLLKFPSAIRYADFGNGDITGKILQTKRVLRVKGKFAHFGVTSLSVITADGQYYEFLVRYADTLPYLAWDAQMGRIPADTLWVGSGKTTHLIATQPVADYVLGNDTLIAMQDKQIDNMIKVKALEPFVAPSSLSLVDATDSVYCFVALFDDTRQELTRRLGSSEPVCALFNDRDLNETEFDKLSHDVSVQKNFLSNLGTYQHKMEFSLTGIFSYNDLIFFKLHLHNASQIDYAVDFVKMYIRDRKSGKKVAVQEEELTPLFTYCAQESGCDLLQGDESVDLILCFRRFTLPEKRGLYFEMFERNGGRHLRFQITSKSLLKSRKISLNNHQ